MGLLHTGPVTITPAMRDAVRKAAGIGLPLRQIARMIVDPISMKAISVRTLEKQFKNDLEDGLAEANHKVSSKLLELCLEGNFNAIKWWETTRQGRFEKRDFRGMSNAGELNLKPEHLSKLTNEQLHALEAMLRVVAAGVGAAGTSNLPAVPKRAPPKLIEIK